MPGVMQSVLHMLENAKPKIQLFIQETVVSPTGKWYLIYTGTGMHNSVCCGGRGD